MRITVIGGGIVGLCCALELHRGGAEVTLVERGRCGQATSRGNAGWIVPAITLPVATPGITWQALRWLLNPSSPARLKPRADPALARWCWQFWRHASGARYTRVLESMLSFNRRAVASFDALKALGIDFDMRDNDFMIAALGSAALDDYHTLFDDLAHRGYPEFVAGQDLDGDAARRLEPALSARIQGAILLEHQRQVRPETVSAGVYRYLVDAGVEIKEDTAVTGLAPDPQKGWRIDWAAGDMHADTVVVAAGLWSNALTGPLGYTFPLQGARGCSVTARGAGTRPARSIKMAEAQVALNPFVDSVRLSGTWDLTGNDAALDSARLRHVVGESEKYLADWRPEDVEFEWAGLRPSTPDSLPLIGALDRRRGLYLAAGHGMFGLTYSPLTGAAIRELVLEERTPPESRPLDPARWLG